MATKDVELTEHFERFIAERVASGEYRDAGEVIRDALRLLERQRLFYERKLDRLKAAVHLGFEQIDRGEHDEIDLADLDRWFDEAEEEALARGRAPDAAE